MTNNMSVKMTMGMTMGMPGWSEELFNVYYASIPYTTRQTCIVRSYLTTSNRDGGTVETVGHLDNIAEVVKCIRERTSLRKEYSRNHRIRLSSDYKDVELGAPEGCGIRKLSPEEMSELRTSLVDLLQ